MSDRPDPLTFNGFVVPIQCCLCHRPLKVSQSKRLLLRLNYETTVVHLDCKMANKDKKDTDFIQESFNKNQSHVNFGKELGEKFGTARVGSFTSDTDTRSAEEVLPDEVTNRLNLLESLGNAPRKARTFDTGATRDTDEGKLDFEAFLSPAVIIRYAEHLHKHAMQSDGEMRPGDNWQRGIKKEVYAKSMHRHFIDVWCHNRNRSDLAVEDLETALCALMFNVMGYLFEVLKEKDKDAQKK